MNLKEILGDAYKEGMTFEEIETALAKIKQPEDLSAEVERLKTAVSKSNKEAADYKKQLKDKMTEDELAKQQEAEDRKKLQEAYDALLRENTISKQTARFVSLGYDEKLATETAEAFADGNFDKVFANQKAFQEGFEQTIRADVLKNTPKPKAGAEGEGTMTLKKLREMASADRLKFSEEHPDEYKTLYEGEK